jgi:hypothetical protein
MISHEGRKALTEVLAPGHEEQPLRIRFFDHRKSKCEAVDVRFNEAFFPADFFLLKQKEKEGGITGEEWKRLHTYMKDIILKYPVKPVEELFGRPKPYKVIIWGTLEHGESDRHIRKMRQEEREGRNVKPERQNSLSPN